MPLFYPFGIPTTSSYSANVSQSYWIKATPQIRPNWALDAQSGPKGPPGTPPVGCPPGYLDASIENTITYSGDNGTHVQSYPPIPYKSIRKGVDNTNRSTGYTICYPIPTPTPTNALPQVIVPISTTLLFVTASTEVVPGASVDAAVQVRNEYGSGIGYPVAVTWSIASPGSGSLASSSNFTDAYGNSQVTAWIVGTYTGSQYIEALASGSVTGNPVQFEAQVVASSSFYTQTSASLSAYNAIAGTTVTMRVVVRDQFGNQLIGIGNGAPLTLSPSNSHFVATAGTGASIGNFTCISGSCTATLTPNTAIGTRVAVTTTVPGQNQQLTQGGSLTMITLPATPSFLMITGSTDQIAGDSQTIQVTMYDQYSNICNSGSFSGSGAVNVTFAGATASPDTTTPTVAGTNFGSATTLTFSNGVASAAMILYDAHDNPEVDTIAVSGTFHGNSITTSAVNAPLVVNVTPATAAEFFVEWPSPASLTTTTDETPTLSFTALDAYENRVGSGTNNYTGAKTITFSGATNGPDGTSPTARNNLGADVNFGTGTAITFNNGQASSIVRFKKVETGTLTVTDSSISDTIGFAVGPGTLQNFTITGDATQFAGSGQTITVVARDTYDNILNGSNSGTNYNGSIGGHIFAGAAASPGGNNPTVAGTAFGSGTTLSFSNGTATATMILYDATGQPENDVISITSPVASETNLSVAVSPADPLSSPVGSIDIAGGTTQTAGVSQNVTLRVYDAYRNLCASGTYNYNYPSGRNITFSGADAAPDGTNPTAAGTAFNAGAKSIVFTNGVSDATAMVLYDAEVDTISVSDGTISSTYSGDTLTVTVSPNTAVDIGMKRTSDNATSFSMVAGSTVGLTFTAFDDYRNVATGYTGTKNLTFTGASSSPAPSSTPPTIGGQTFSSVNLGFSSGTVTADMILYKVESVTLDFDNNTNAGVDPVDSGDTLSISVTQGAAFSITKTAGDTQTATVNTAVSTDPEVLVRDQWSNPRVGDTVTFSVQAGGGSATGTSQTTDSNGYATVTSWTLGTTAAASAGVGGNTLRATTGALSTDFTATAQPAAANYFTVSKSPSGAATAGTNFDVTVTVYDAYNNLVDWGANDYDGNKNLYFYGFNQAPDGSNPRTFDRNSAWQTFTNAVPVTFANGSTTNAVTLYKAESQTLTVSAESGPAGVQGTLAITVNRTTTTMTVKQGDGQTADAGSSVATVPEVYIRDTYLNPHVGHTVTWTISSGGGSRTNATNATDSNGVATVGGWTLGTTAGSNNNTLTASASGYSNVVFTATAQPATVNYITLAYSSGGTSSGNMQAGGAGEGGQNDYFVLLTAKDVYGNTCSFGSNNINAYYDTVWGGANTSPGGNGTSTAEVPKAFTDADAAVNFGGVTGRTWTNGTVTYKIRLYKVETANLTARLYTNYPTNTVYVDQNATHAVAVALGPIGGGQGTMGANSATTQTPTVNANATAPSVKITDDYGNPASGISVSFVRNAGSGCLVAGSGQTTNTSCVDIGGTTDGNGVITLGQWGPMPTTAADNASDYDEQLTAYCGTTPSSIVFYAAPQPAAVNYLSVSKVEGGNAVAGVSFTSRVIAKDVYNNTVGWGSNATITQGTVRSLIDGYVDTYFAADGNWQSPDGSTPQVLGGNPATTPVKFMGYAGSGAAGKVISNGINDYTTTLYKAGTLAVTASLNFSTQPDAPSGSYTVTVVTGSIATSDSSIALGDASQVENTTSTLTLLTKDVAGNPYVSDADVTVTVNNGSVGAKTSDNPNGTYTWTYTFPSFDIIDADTGTSQKTYSNAITATISGNNIVGSPLTVIAYDTAGVTYEAEVCGSEVPDGISGYVYRKDADGAGDFNYYDLYGQVAQPCCSDAGPSWGTCGAGCCEGTCCSDGINPVYYCCGIGGSCGGGNCL